MLKITEIREPEGGAPEPTANEYIAAVKYSRDKVRSLGSALVGSCGTLLSASFAIIIYQIKETNHGITTIIGF